MILKVKNKDTLLVDDFIFKCSTGKKGLKKSKKEGDKCTPIGLFSLGKIYYRPDRLDRPETNLKIIPIKKNMGWCDDPKSENYNKLIKLPFEYSCEKLYKRENIYDIIIVLDFNINPIIKNKGSAIFIHVAKKNYLKTEGCIAVKKTHLLKIIKEIRADTKVVISNQR